MKFIVNGMSCDHCVRSVTDAVTQLDPAAVVEVDLAGKRVRVQSSKADPASVQAAIAAAGYEVKQEA